MNAIQQLAEALRWIANDDDCMLTSLQRKKALEALAAYEAQRKKAREALAAYEAQQAEPITLGPEWTPCVKLPVTVHVRAQRDGETHVSTREGITPVKPDDLIMRGVSGEEYPIGRAIFEQTYRLGEQAEPVEPDWLGCARTGEAFPASVVRAWSPENRKRMTVRLYTHPAAPKPLTEEQALSLWKDAHWKWETNALAFARAIEAAHGIGIKEQAK